MYPSQTRVLAQLQRARAEVSTCFDEMSATETKRVRAFNKNEKEATSCTFPPTTLTYRDFPALKSLVDEKHLYLVDDGDDDETAGAGADDEARW